MEGDYFENAMNESVVAAECAEILSRPIDNDPDFDQEDALLVELSDSYFGLKLISPADDADAEEKLRRQLIPHFYEDTRKRIAAMSSLRAAQIKIEAGALLNAGENLREYHRAALKTL